MDWHNPLIACVLFLVGGAFFVTSIAVPAWSYNSQNERIGIWDLCYREGQQQCYSSDYTLEKQPNLEQTHSLDVHVALNKNCTVSQCKTIGVQVCNYLIIDLDLNSSVVKIMKIIPHSVHRKLHSCNASNNGVKGNCPFWSPILRLASENLCQPISWSSELGRYFENRMGNQSLREKCSTIGIAIFAIFVKTFSNINDLTWGGALLIVTSIFILVSGLFGVIVIKTATDETETTRSHKYSAKTPLVCLLQSQNYAYSNEAFKYHDNMTLLKPATANGHGNTRPLHQMSYL
ncbi:hypothetical protein CAPTEDRAFT_201376 [Capitella teleta]|uniref:Uncharacterized protein n=1 Tax=Capitella teleta TaxID=283909 RepID=R7TI49_CAPTE|nr:hypothetical protein CAPTEDRAFT_201376 [Capitella teleta]|eukprot:ELT93157.1 hypothetical protein CAPTEDRAFT_201376 [Capitella teleta]